MPDGTSAGTLILLGWTGGRSWPAFAGSPEAADRRPDPLDRWSRRVIDALAATLDAVALYPFGGPPWHPFQRWGMRAERMFQSPLRVLVHPEWGLWHSYRGAIALRETLELPHRPAPANPCEGCAAKPCLAACPVGAFTAAGYDVDACAAHLRSPEGADCRSFGCLARRACPVGREQAYGTDEAAFYMEAFVAARAGAS
jgi:ferredoxin